MSKDTILEKLAKMKALQEGEAALGHTEAAENFAAIINNMLLKHQLEVADIPLNGGQAKTVEEAIIEHMVQMNTPDGIEFKRTRVAWQSALAGVVARYNFCRYLVQAGNNRIWFVGTESHAKVAEYVFVTLVRAADKMSIKARLQYSEDQKRSGARNAGAGYRESWLQAFVQRIDERLGAERRQAEASASTALVSLRQPMDRVNDYMNNRQFRGKPLSMTKHRMTNHSAGWNAGRTAADRINLGGKAVGGGSGPKLLK